MARGEVSRALIVVISLLAVCWVIIRLSDEQIDRDIGVREKNLISYLSEDSPSIVVWKGKPKNWNKPILYILPQQTKQLAEFIQVYEVETIGLYPFNSLEEAEAFVRKSLWEIDKDRRGAMGK